MTPEMTSPQREWRSHLPALILLVLVLAISVTVRIRLLDAPLERDEGEHAYMAQTMLQGHAPWRLAYGMKLPGTDAMYALFLAIFGQTATAIRLGLLLINTATILLVALLGKRLFGLTGGAIAGAAYGLLSCSQDVLGSIAHSTHFVVFFAVIATIVLMKPDLQDRQLFLAGLLYGLAFLMKQPGICFAAFAALYVLWCWWRDRLPFARGLKRLALFSIGVVLPYALLCLALWRAGVFGRFWFWTVTLAGAYAGQFTLHQRFEYFKLGISSVIDPNLFIWILAGLGLIMACWNPATRRAGLWTAALLPFSFVAVALGGVFNPHYFILLLPALALACGAWADRTSPNGHITGVLVLLFGLACLYSVIAQRDYLFAMTPYEFARSSFGQNPFPEAVQIADYIRANSDPRARIAVLGSEAEIYFYARRQAATGYMFTYSLMETHQYAEPAQGEMIGEILASKPEYIVLVKVQTSWLVRRDSSQAILYWLTDYVRNQYEPAGAVELVDGQPSIYIWGPESAAYRPRTNNYLLIYRRK
jgi:4-amino-4-deoxy-L-arabinose transferase-like glycosyltransferase